MSKENAPPPADNSSVVRRLMIFFALVSLAQGLGQLGGIINQPLVYFLKQQLGWAPDQVTRYFAWLIIPWIVKPIYGLLSDFVPILGYHRKPYLILANLLTAGGFLWMMGMVSPTSIFVALLLTTIGMAACSTITEAVLVENGNKSGSSGTFLNQKWIWFNVASIVSSLGAGWLAQSLSPTSAFHTAALIAAIVPAMVAVFSWFLVDEKPAARPFPRPAVVLPPIFKSRKLWVTAAFLFVCNIVPSFGTPLYFHMVDDLKFDQRFIGILGAVSSAGSILGGLLYAWLSKKLSLQQLLYLSLGLTTVSQLGYLDFLMTNSTLALIVSFINGIFGMIALVSTLTVAAHAVPDKSAGFVFAVLMSVNNLSGQLGSNLGASLFVHVFHHQLNLVIYVSAVATAACAVMVPILKLGNQRGDEVRKLAASKGLPSEQIALSECKRLPNSSANGQ